MASDGPKGFAKCLAGSRLVRGLDELVLEPEEWFTNDEDLAPWLSTLTDAAVVPRLVLRTKGIEVTVHADSDRTVECETERGSDIAVLRKLRKIGRLVLRDRKSKARPLSDVRELRETLDAIKAKVVEMPSAWQEQLEKRSASRARS